jgi:hypothetical protein
MVLLNVNIRQYGERVRVKPADQLFQTSTTLRLLDKLKKADDLLCHNDYVATENYLREGLIEADIGVFPTIKFTDILAKKIWKQNVKDHFPQTHLFYRTIVPGSHKITLSRLLALAKILGQTIKRQQRLTWLAQSFEKDKLQIVESIRKYQYVQIISLKIENISRIANLTSFVRLFEKTNGIKLLGTGSAEKAVVLEEDTRQAIEKFHRSRMLSYKDGILRINGLSEVELQRFFEKKVIVDADMRTINDVFAQSLQSLVFEQGLSEDQEHLLDKIFREAKRKDLCLKLDKLHDDNLNMHKQSIKFEHKLLLTAVEESVKLIKETMAKYLIPLSSIREMCAYGFSGVDKKAQVDTNNGVRTIFDQLGFSSIKDYMQYNAYILQTFSGIEIFNDYVDKIIEFEKSDFESERIIPIELDEHEQKFIKTIPGLEYDFTNNVGTLSISLAAADDIEHTLLHAIELNRKQSVFWEYLNKKEHMEAVVKINVLEKPLVLRFNPKTDVCLVYRGGQELGALNNKEDLGKLPVYLTGDERKLLRQSYIKLHQKYSLNKLRQQGLNLLLDIQSRAADYAEFKSFQPQLNGFPLLHKNTFAVPGKVSLSFLLPR